MECSVLDENEEDSDSEDTDCFRGAWPLKKFQKCMKSLVDNDPKLTELVFGQSISKVPLIEKMTQFFLFIQMRVLKQKFRSPSSRFVKD